MKTIAQRINKPAVNELKKLLREDPLRFDMGIFISGMCPQDKVWPSCKTVGCIAGWIILKDRLLKNSLTVTSKNLSKIGRGQGVADYCKEASKILGLNVSAARKLFFVNDWPEMFRDKFYKMNYEWCNVSPQSGREKLIQIKRRMVEVAIRRINYFIRTGK